VGKDDSENKKKGKKRIVLERWMLSFMGWRIHESRGKKIAIFVQNKMLDRKQ
jgi:hypothetical protein